MLNEKGKKREKEEKKREETLQIFKKVVGLSKSVCYTSRFFYGLLLVCNE